jgi:hypothetical protein
LFGQLGCGRIPCIGSGDRCANLYERAGQGNPDDVAAKVRADGGISDAQMVGDTEAAVK